MEQTKTTKIRKHNIEEPIEYLNDKYLVALDIVEQGKLPSYLESCGYEKIFKIRSLQQLKTILGDKVLEKNLQDKIKQLGFKKTTCSFIFEGRFSVPLSLQQEIIDFQANVFDEVTITHLRHQPNDLLHCIEYAKKKEKEIAVLTDFAYTKKSIKYAAKTVLDDIGIQKLKVKHKRLVGNKDRYSLIASLFSESNKNLHLVLCSKKIKIFKYKNFSFEFLARIYGFTSYCQYYREPEPNKKKSNKPKRFILLGFQRSDLFYAKTRGLSLQGQGLKDIGEIDSEMRNLNQYIANNKLQQYLTTKVKYKNILVNLKLI